MGDTLFFHTFYVNHFKTMFPTITLLFCALYFCCLHKMYLYLTFQNQKTKKIFTTHELCCVVNCAFFPKFILFNFLNTQTIKHNKQFIGIKKFAFRHLFSFLLFLDPFLIIDSTYSCVFCFTTNHHIFVCCFFLAFFCYFCQKSKFRQG